jgi:hypothetical protein
MTRAANFVQETTTSIAGTSGDGAVTTTAISLSPRLSNALGTQATTVRYVIQQASTGKAESGIGVISANVLTRSRPQITWDGTTFKDASTGAVAPLQFGSSPTAGDVVIRIAPLAESAPMAQPGRQTLIAGDGVWDNYPFSRHLIPNNNGQAVSFSADREYYACYYNEVPGLLVGSQIDLMSGTGNLKRAVYDVNSSGLPGNKILTLNNVTLSGTGAKTDTASGTWIPAGGIWIPAGWLVLGFISDAAFTMRGAPMGQAHTLYNRVNGYGFTDTLWKAGSYAAGLPAVPNLTGGSMGTPTGTNGCAWLGLKVVA